MSSEKTMYWVSVAVLAVVVGNHFVNRYQGGCVIDRATAAVQRLTADATHFSAMAQAVFAGNPQLATPELQLARMQGRFASIEANMARQQAACARAQAHHARMMALRLGFGQSARSHLRCLE
ncbi:MAG TPA: hypothetical protein VEI26_10340 [Terriglobales bacterium]|nr:hypothetical protein [Terriglobales bacterium]